MNIGSIKGRMGRRLSLLALSGAAALASVVATSTHAQEKSRCDDKASSVARLSDAEVFIGVFYGSGDGAALKPALTEAKQIKSRNNTATATEVVEALEAKYPGYLAEFRKEVTSGDREVIEAAVKETIERLTDVSIPFDPGTRAGCVLVCWNRDPSSIYEQLANDELFRAEFADAVAQSL